MNTKLMINNKEYPIGHATLEDSIYRLPDDSTNLDILRQLAMAPSSTIRGYVASNLKIDNEIASTLLQDTQLTVLKSLVNNRHATKFISEDRVMELLKRDDSELCSSIAENIEYFGLCNHARISEELLKNSDPVVRMALAENSSVPNHILRKLINDNDADVAQSARNSLSFQW